MSGRSLRFLFFSGTTMRLGAIHLVAIFAVSSLSLWLITKQLNHVQRFGINKIRVSKSGSNSSVASLPADSLFHEPLRRTVDFAGVLEPDFIPANEAQLPGTVEVVGVTVGDQRYGFVLSGMDAPEKHIVSFVSGSQRISVTYCNLASCVRVLRGDASLPALRVGGLDARFQMVFLLDGKRYGQESTKLPLQDIPFTRTSYEEWKLAHPDTLIFRGDATAVNES